MATIIDELVVKLGLNSKDLEKKIPGVTKALKEVETQGEKTTASVDNVAGSAAKLLAVLGGTVALKNWITGFIEANGALKRLSDNLGIAVETISSWSQASEQLGGSAAGLQGTFSMLSRAQTQLRLTGESNLIPYFSQLGVSLAGINGKARPVEEILLNLADRFATMDRPEANNLGLMMGIDQGTMNLLLRGRVELEATIKRQKESGAVTKAQAEEAYKLEVSINKLKQGYAALGRTLLESALPYLEKLLDWFQKIGDWATKNSDTVGTFLKVIAAGLAAIGIAALPIDGVVVAIVGLAAAIALLWNDYKVWKSGGESLIDWGKWEPGITAATKGIEWLGKVAKATLETVGSLAAITKDLLKGDTAGATKENDSLRDRLRSKLGLKPLGGTAAGAGGGGDAMRDQAERVSKMTGIPADILWSQWAFETGGFKNRGAKDLNNFAGINVPGGKGEDYRSFKTPDEFGDYYAYLMRSNGLYPDAASAKTPEAFAAALKKGGYYSSKEAPYAAGIRQWDDKYGSSMAGVPGASGAAQVGSGGSGDTDARRYFHVGELKVYTQATDGPGIAQDTVNAMDYLFTSQANTGLQ